MFLASLNSAVWLIETRRLGVARRVLSTPTSARALIAGIGLGRLGVALLQALLIVVGSLLLFGVHWGDPAGAAVVIVAFCLVNVLAVVPITPGGLGLFEAVLPALLVGFGLGHSEATVAVLSYRIAQYWLPIPLGAIAYATLRLGPQSLRKIRGSHPIRELAGDTADLADRRVWDVDDAETSRPRTS